MQKWNHADVREESEDVILRRLDIYKVKKRNNPTLCKAMEDVVRQHLGYVDATLVVAGAENHVPRWEKRSSRQQLNEAEVKDRLTTSACTSAFLDSIPESRKRQLYDEFLNIINGYESRNFRQDSITTKVFANFIPPEGFMMGDADGDGDCFFHACAQGLSSIFQEHYTTEGLRRLCQDYMQEHARLGFSGNWIYDVYKKRILARNKSFSKEKIALEAKKEYLNRTNQISLSAGDLKSCGLEPNSMWAEQEIDGRIICIEINKQLAKNGSESRIRIHAIEVRDEIITHHLVDDEDGERSVNDVSEVDALYKSNDIIHVICCDLHWKPILLSSSKFTTRNTASSYKNFNVGEIAQRLFHAETESTAHFVGYEQESYKRSIEDHKQNDTEPSDNEYNRIESALGSEVVQVLRSYFASIENGIVTFSQYLDYGKNETLFKKIIVDCTIAADELDKAQSQELCNYLFSLEVKFSDKIYSRRIAFVQKAVELGADATKILFDGMLRTKENIKKRGHELVLCFHPDKCDWVRPRHASKVRELAIKILEWNKSLIERLEREQVKLGELKFHKKEGDEYWQQGEYYERLFKGDFNKLEESKEKAEYACLGSHGLNAKIKVNFELAKEAYKAACNVADRERLLEEQVELRGKMALCLYKLPGQTLEAQVYSISAINIICNFSNKTTIEQLRRAQEIFKIVRGEGNIERQVAQNATDNAFAIIRIANANLTDPVNKAYAFNDIERVKASLEEELQTLTAKLIVKSDRSLVKYQTAQEDILKAKISANKYKNRGLASQVAGGGIGVTSVGFAGMAVWEATAAVSSAAATAQAAATTAATALAAVQTATTTAAIAAEAAAAATAATQAANAAAAAQAAAYSWGWLSFFSTSAAAAAEAATSAAAAATAAEAFAITAAAEAAAANAAAVASVANANVAAAAVQGAAIVGAGTVAMCFIGGCAVLFGGVYIGLNLIRKGDKLLEEPAIREELNNIIASAVNEYIKGNCKGFIKELTKTSVASTDYELCLMSDLTSNRQPKKGNLYVITDGVSIRYKVVAPNDKVVEDEIRSAEMTIPTDNSIENLKMSLSDILRITSNRGHTLTKPRIAPQILSLDTSNITLSSVTVDKAEKYELCLMSDLEQNKQLKKDKLYVTIEDSAIKYKAITPNGETIEGYINNKEMKIPSDNSIQALQKSLPDILRVTAKRGNDLTKENVLQIILLKNHGFRPDGIAYLLNLIGEALSGGHVKGINGIDDVHIASCAAAALEAVGIETLKKHADELDHKIHELRRESLKKQGRLSNVLTGLSRLKSEIMLDDDLSLAEEHIKDAQKMPFNSRLQEMRDVATLNLAIIDLVSNKPERIAKARQRVAEVKESANTNSSYIFGSKLKQRLEALEDFLWVISGQVISDSVTNMLMAVNKPALLLNSDANSTERELIDLRARLQNASTPEEKVYILCQIAADYESLANDEAKSNMLVGLRYWQDACKKYEQAFLLNKKNDTARLGILRCLSKLSKHTQAIDFLSQNCSPDSGKAGYWEIGATSFYKKLNYETAKDWFTEAQRFETVVDKKEKIRKKQELIVNIEKRKEDGLKVYKNEHPNELLKYSEEYFSSRRTDETKVYNILSIDGGGIRGILPALWLSEIEKKMHKPISHLFNMMAGTSTGGIIAAGLSTPYMEETQQPVIVDNEVICLKKPSLFRPRYSAYDIVQLYVEKPKQIFSKSMVGALMPTFNAIVTSRYTSDGRASMFNDYFGEARLDQMLTDVVIPAAYDNDVTNPYLFTTHDSKKDKHKNELIVDALMATSAAPTFFRPHWIEGKGIFYDGGVHVNNPADVAYREFLRYRKDVNYTKRNVLQKDRVFMLSMGTGTYIPDPLNPNMFPGQLFWAYNLHKIALPAQEGNTGILMNSILNHDNAKGYERWQVMLEEPIPLDACEKDNIEELLDVGMQYLEELYDSDENRMNKLLEFLDKEQLKSQDRGGYGVSSMFFKYGSRPVESQLEKIFKKYNITELCTTKEEVALRRAAANGSEEDVRYIIKKFPHIINYQDEKTNKRTALHWAVDRKHADVAKLLINSGASLNIKDAAFKTAEDYINDSKNQEMIYMLKSVSSRLDLI